jgi:hypothetical protein
MAIQTLLDPVILSRLSSIELVAKTVVDGFLVGLHRSPFFGFSLEFAEYRPYVPGDDPRFIDWNVFSRTDRTYLKRYLGETNSHLVILFDASASMGYGSGGVKKIEYARFAAAALAYLSLVRPPFPNSPTRSPSGSPAACSSPTTRASTMASSRMNTCGWASAFAPTYSAQCDCLASSSRSIRATISIV